jgi:hypothetical protein
MKVENVPFYLRSFSTFSPFLPSFVLPSGLFYPKSFSAFGHPTFGLSTFGHSTFCHSTYGHGFHTHIQHMNKQKTYTLYKKWISRRRHRHIRRPLDLKQEWIITMLNPCVQFYACSDNVQFFILRQLLLNKILISNLSFVTRPRGFLMKIEVKANGS